MARPAIKEIYHHCDGNVVLFKRPNSKKWQARLKLPTGEWKHISTKQIDQADAAKFAEEQFHRVKFRVEENLAPESKSFRKVCRLYIAELEAALTANVGKVSYTQYINMLRNWAVPYFGDKHIDKIGYQVLSEFSRHRALLLGREASKSTVSTHNAALNGVFKYALRQGWFKDWQMPVFPREGTNVNKRPAFDLQEYRELRRISGEWIKDGKTRRTREIRQQLYSYIQILYHTGMRPGLEPLTLRWKDLERWTHPTTNKRYVRIWVRKGKTKDRQLIARWGAYPWFMRLKDASNYTEDDDLIFVREDGTVTKEFPHLFRQLLDHANLAFDRYGDVRTLYSLRHTYCTNQLTLGHASFHIIARNMGTSTAMLEKHYSHLVPTMNAEQLTYVPPTPHRPSNMPG
jgi:integrase